MKFGTPDSDQQCPSAMIFKPSMIIFDPPGDVEIPAQPGRPDLRES